MATLIASLSNAGSKCLCTSSSGKAMRFEIASASNARRSPITRQRLDTAPNNAYSLPFNSKLRGILCFDMDRIKILIFRQ